MWPIARSALCAFGLVFCAVAQGAVPVPGAAWTLNGNGWTEADRAWIADLPARLPPAWTTAPVTLTRTAAPLATTDLSAPDTVAVAHGREIALRIAGLDAPAELLQRQLAHAITHVVDADRRWSSDPAFRGISGWPRWPWRGPAAERDPLTFARPEGMASPAEDLATAADLLLFPDGGDAPCHLPSKVRFLVAHAGLTPPPAGVCAVLAEVGLDPGRVAEIDLVYVVATAQAASIGGHMLVAVRQLPDAAGNTAEDAYGLVADTGDSRQEGLKFLVMGVTGGFPARVVWEPLETTFLRYSEIEQRDLRLYRMVLTDAQKATVLARLDEIRQGWDRPYAFFNANCVRLPEELALALVGPGFPRPRPLSPDVLLAALARRGLIAEVPPDRLAAWSVAARAMAAAPLIQGAESTLLSADPVSTAALRGAFRQIQDPEAKTRATGYSALAGLAPRLRPDPGSRTALLHLLAWRDPAEAVAWAEARAHGASGPNPALDPLRVATLAARGDAPPALDDLGDTALEANLARDRSKASSHTPFRTLGVFPTAIWDGDQPWFGLGYATTLYDGHVGPGRRFPVGDNPTVTLLSEELAVGVAPFHLWSHSTLVRALYLPLSPRPVRAGFDVTLADLTLRDDALTPLSGTWLSASGVLALRQSPRWQRDVRLSLGLAVQSEGAPDGLIPPLQLAAPLGLELELGSGRQQRTALRLRGASGPVATIRGDLLWESQAAAEAGLRLGEVAGTDIILSAGGAARLGAVGNPAQLSEGSARVGLLLERF